MRVRKAIKKIGALGVGISMIGATVLGAMAVDLSEYPDPLFITDGVFDGTIVVGDQAAAEDVVGAINIATSLQYAVRQPVPQQTTGGGTALSISGDVAPFADANDMLEIRELLGQVKETLTEFDLAGLQGGTIVTDEGATDYNQFLRFEDNLDPADDEYIPAGFVTFEEDEDDIVGDYLKIKSGDEFFEFELEFEEGAESRVENNKLRDLEDEEVNILGQVFSVVDTYISGKRVKLELLGGDVLDTMEEGETRTYTIDGKEYEVNLLIISDSGNGVDRAKFVVNGEVTDQLEDGDTDVLRDGTEIGIRDLLPNEAEEETGGDLAEFYLGAHKVELEDTDVTDDSFCNGCVEVRNEDIEDGRVKIRGSYTNTDNSTWELTSIQYRLEADAPKGDVYVPPGHGVKEYLDEPEGMLSDVWDIRYEGLHDTGVSIVRIDSSGDDSYDFMFTNKEGLEYNFPLVDNSRDTINSWKWGEDDDDLIFQEGWLNDTDISLNVSSGNLSLIDHKPGNQPNTVTNVTLAGMQAGVLDACSNFAPIDEDDNFLLTDEPEDETSFTHILSYESVDMSNRELTFSDEATGQRQITFDDNAALVPNPCVLGFAQNLVVGGNTYDVYVTNRSTASSDDDKYPLVIDMDSDGRVDGEEIQLVNNGGGIWDLGTQNPLNFSLGADSDEPYKTSALIPGNNFTMQLRTMASEFDGDGILDTGEDEIINITIEARSGNEVDLDVPSPQKIEGDFDGDGINESYTVLRMESLNEEDLDQGLSTYGVFLEQTDDSSSNDAEDLTIEYPLSQRGADVFVVIGSTQISRVGGAAGQAVVLNPINVGQAKLASEVAGQEMSLNLISVGGPCINAVTAKLMGSDTPLCGEESGMEAGKGVIKLVQNGDYVAMIVAGYSAQDTRRATKVVAEYEDWADKLVGMEVEVTGTSMADIDVMAPTVATA